MLKALLGTDTVETESGSHEIRTSSWADDSVKERRSANWLAAWKQCYGAAIMCEDNQEELYNIACKKGYNVIVLKYRMINRPLIEYGIPTVNDVTSQDEKDERTITPPSFEAIDAVKQVWDWVEAADLAPGKDIPKVKGFDERMKAESDTLGFFRDEVVFIRNDVGGDLLLETALEEVTHAVTGATDNSRDFQTFLTRLAVRWLK